MKKAISIAVISMIVLASCSRQDASNTAESIKYKQVGAITAKNDFIKEDIRLAWKVSASIETPIIPLVSWTVKEIFADAWKIVKAWEVLATINLDNTTYKTSLDNASNAYWNTLNAYLSTEESIKNDLESARIQLENAKTNRDNAYSTTDKQLKAAQTQLDNIKTTKWNTDTTTKESLKSAELWVDLATKSLENSKTNLSNFEKTSNESINSLNSKVSWLYNTIKTTVENWVISIDSALTQADLLLWVTDKNKNANSSYAAYLSAKDINIKRVAEREFITVNWKFQTFKANRKYSTNDEVSATLASMVEINDMVSALYDDLIHVLDNSVTSSTFTQSQLDAIRWTPWVSWISWKQSSLLSMKSWLVTLENSLSDMDSLVSSTNTSIETTRISLTNAVSIAETQLENAKQSLANLKAWNASQLDNVSGNEKLLETQLESTQANVKSTRDNVDNALRIAQAQYDSTKAKLTLQQTQTKLQLDNAKWWKDLAKIQLDNTKIIAPFDWIILSRSIEVGWPTWPSSAAFMIWSDISKKIKIDVTWENASLISLWQEVRIAKWSITYTWVISLISPSSDPTTKMYKIEASIIGDWQWINLWDYIDVFILKENKSKKVIMIPLSSIISLWQWDYSVFIINWNKQVVSRDVKIWAQSQWNVEITSWLKEWEKVVTSWTLNIQDWDYVKE